MPFKDFQISDTDVLLGLLDVRGVRDLRDVSDVQNTLVDLIFFHFLFGLFCTEFFAVLCHPTS